MEKNEENKFIKRFTPCYKYWLKLILPIIVVMTIISTFMAERLISLNFLSDEEYYLKLFIWLICYSITDFFMIWRPNFRYQSKKHSKYES